MIEELTDCKVVGSINSKNMIYYINKIKIKTYYGFIIKFIILKASFSFLTPGPFNPPNAFFANPC